MGETQLQSGAVHLVTVLLVLILIVIGGIGVVAASDSAKPGDPLYPIDIAIEDIRLTMATTSNEQIRLRTSIAQERIQEINYLLDEMGVYAPGLDIALINFLEHVRYIEGSPATTDDDYVGYWEYDLLYHQRDQFIEQLLDSQEYADGSDREQLLRQLKAAQEEQKEEHSVIVSTLKDILSEVTGQFVLFK